MEGDPMWIDEHIKKLEDMLKRRQCHFRQPFSVFSMLKDMPALSDRDVDPFLDACLRRRLYDCVMVAAVRYNRIERMLNMEELNFRPPPEGQVWNHVMKYLASEGRWSCIMKLSSRFCSSVSTAVFMCFIKDNCLKGSLSNEGLEAFGFLLDCRLKYSPKQGVVKELLSTVTDLGLAKQFKILIHCKHECVRRVVWGAPDEQNFLVSLIRRTCLARLCDMDDPALGPRTDFNGVLSAACEAGLFSVPALRYRKQFILNRPMILAIEFNQPDMVAFLYEAGWVNNHDLFSLSRYPGLEIKAKATNRGHALDLLPPLYAPYNDYPGIDDVKAAKEIRAFLTHKASRPRSLQNICLHEVSKRIGWGHVRDANIEKLEIPPICKSKLRFEGVKALLKEYKEPTTK